MVVDRLTAKATSKQRITDSVETALGLAGGLVDPRLRRPARGRPAPRAPLLRAAGLPERPPAGHRRARAAVVLVQLAVRRLPGLHRASAPARRSTRSWSCPTRKPPWATGAIAPWATGQTSEYFLRLLQGVADAEGFDLDTPWERLPARAQKAVLHGTGRAGARPVPQPVRPRALLLRRATRASCRGSSAGTPRPTATTPGRSTRATCARCPARPARAPGSSRRSWRSRSPAGRSPRCARCRSARRPSSCRAVRLTEREQIIAERVLKEIHARLGFLVDVGLDYLSLDRAAATLAGGEAQRIRLATQIGSGLVGVLYVLDEPSIGLHQRDNHRLIETLVRLRDLGNTLIVVEHDEDTIRAADWVVDIGPRAGEHGGNIVVSGTVSRTCSPPRNRSPAPTCPAGAAIEVPAGPPAAAAGPRAGRRGRPRAQPAQHRRGVPARLLRRGHRGVRLRQVDAGQRHPLHDAGQQDQRRQAAAGPAQAGPRRRAAGQGRRRRPVADRPHPAVQPGHLHRACSTTSASCSPRPPRRRSAATSRAGSPSTSRAVAARTARATAPSRSR